MAFLNFSSDWDATETGEELCKTFVKDSSKRNRKKHKRNNKNRIKQNNIDNFNKDLDNKRSYKGLKSKKGFVKSLKKNISGFHVKDTNKERLEDPINTVFKGSSKLNPTQTKKRLKRKRTSSETVDDSDTRPLLKKNKFEKIKNVTQESSNTIEYGNFSSIGAKMKKRNKKVKSKRQNGDILPEVNGDVENKSSKKSKKKEHKNLEIGQIVQKTINAIDINKKVKKKKFKKTNGDLTKTNLLADTSIDPIQLKKRKRQLEKLQNLILDKQEKSNSKKDEPVLTLRQKMMRRLKAARFRFLNEQIYTATSKETEKIFRSDPEAFKAYHEGYRQQVQKWPLNPLDRIIKSINKMPKTHVIADFGCGEARLAKSVEQNVHSFDLVAVNDTVTPCDMAHVPLQDASVDVAVFCLSLMGTNLKDYLLEANRVLKNGGLLKIAEVESRFEDINTFINDCKQFHFKKIWMDLSHNLFYFIDFRKESSLKGKKKLPSVTLQPCLYKKR